MFTRLWQRIVAALPWRRSAIQVALNHPIVQHPRWQQAVKRAREDC